MKFIIVYIFVLFVIFCIASCQEDESIVQTKYGPIRGLVTQNFRRFQGVPFATPPLGKLRFKKPIPPSPWTDVKNCTNFIIGCAQSGHSMDVPKNVSEDCLYLEVWTPRVGVYKKPAAVMLFFYGGDFKEGGESFELYNGSWISGTTNTIVVITDYRVGIFGFLYTPVVDANLAIEDQRATLRWVQDNIANFGGDPNMVTIFGQSAGGESVLIHMANTLVPESKMFHKAIVQSGPMSINFRTTTSALILSETFSVYLGCGLEDLRCLQSKNTSEILSAADKTIGVPLDWSEAIMKWGPVVTNNEQFPVEPLIAFEKGNIVKVPFIIGSNLDDGLLFGYAISKTPMAYYEYLAIVAGIFNNDAGAVPTILDYYPPVIDGDNRDILSTLITDYAFLCDSRHTVRLAEQAGVSNTYYYQFTRHSSFCPWPPSQNFVVGKFVMVMN